MSGRLSGKTALVTGAAQGVGRAIALEFLNQGATVIAIDQNVAGVSDFAKTPGASSRGVDVTDAAQIGAVIDEFGTPDALINCVGYVSMGTILDTTLEELHRTLNVNVVASYMLMSAVLPGMLARGSGSIVNIASVVSHVKAAPARFAYAGSKSALLAMCQSVALDFAATGVRVNCISPGTVLSPSLEDRLRQTGNVAAAKQAFIARQPMGRLGMPEEIAAVAVMLASDEARFMTGANVIVDGGFSL